MGRGSSSQGRLILALDQGGHASRAVVYDGAGHEIAQAEIPISTRHSGDDRVEHDAEELVTSLSTAANEVLAGLGRDPRLCAIGLATQRSTIVCWEKTTGRPLSPAISWQDRRGRRFVEQLRTSETLIREVSGLVLSPHYGASKLRWCLENLQAVRRAAAAGRLLAGPLSSFLLARLLKEKPALVDPANAARTQLFEPAACNWSGLLLDAFQVPASVLPQCVPTRHSYGTMPVGRSSAPMRACTGDQAAVPFAFGPPVADTAYVNAGTGAFVQRLTRAQSPVPAGLLRSVLCSEDTNVRYSLEGTVNGAGSAIDWLNDRTDADAQRALSTLSEPAGEEPPLFMNGVGGLGAPYWQPGFPTEFLGEGDEISQLRAVVESIAFLLNVNLALMRGAGPLERIVITGGLASSDYFCRVLADLSRLTVERYDLREATARGTAYLAAGLPEGWQAVPRERDFVPAARPALDARFERWQRAMRQRGA